MLKSWDKLPGWMQCEEVKEYYDILSKRKIAIFIKRVLDIVFAFILLLVLVIPMIGIAILIKIDSQGPVFYRQERVTQYGRSFKIHKFRTMVINAETIGTSITVQGDSRITRVGKKLRSGRLDELPQVIDVLLGNMSFVGTRPEVTKYVKAYTKEMNATLLLPAGVTSEASIRYKDEADLLDVADDVDRVYVEKVLPGKMKYNLESIKKYSLWGDLLTVFRTVLAVLGKDYR